MPTIRYVHPHALDSELASQRIRDSFDDYSKKYRFEMKWERRDRATISGTGFRGTINFPPGEVVLTLDISLLLTPFRSRIESEIASGIARTLA